MQHQKKDKHFIKQPIYAGGPKAMGAFISSHLQYPPEALQQGIEGTVNIRYAIDQKGDVAEAKVISGLGHGCDEEAQRVVRLLKFDVPKTRGLRVLYHKTIHVHFKKPVPQAPPPPAEIQYQYTQSSPVKDDSPTPPPAGYSYTITF
jgi:TonB family protein